MAPELDYPTQFPRECGQTVLQLIREQKVRDDRLVFLQSAWVLQGYLQRLVSAAGLQSGAARGAFDDDEMCDNLEYMIDPHKTTVTVPYANMLQWLLDKISHEALK